MAFLRLECRHVKIVHGLAFAHLSLENVADDNILHKTQLTTCWNHFVHQPRAAS